MKKTRKAHFSLIVAVTLFTVAFAIALPTRAAPPTLAPLSEEELRNVYRAGTTYILHMRYTDPNGDRLKKAQFLDTSASGSTPIDYTRITGTDYRNGVTLEWVIKGFEQGPHQAYFVATSVTGGEARYPEAPDRFYTFKAESLVTKWGLMIGGLVVGLLFVPFLIYVLARSVNRRGDPSRAARVGLLFGILACATLFIDLFADFYGSLTYVIGAIAAVALLVVVLTRR